jgi:hypothetical protein
MYERAMTFAEYVAFYGLSRSEGLLLRYLGDAYRELRQTVPDGLRTDELADLVEWLGAVVRQTDSSLLDEWERLVDPDRVPAPDAEVRPPEPERLTANERAFTVMVRNAMFRRVELAALRRVDELAAISGPSMTAAGWRDALAAYYDEHDRIDTGPDARSPRMLLVDKSPTHWHVQQILGDPEGHHDWRITAVVDLAASDEEEALMIEVTGLRRLEAT